MHPYAKDHMGPTRMRAWANIRPGPGAWSNLHANDISCANLQSQSKTGEVGWPAAACSHLGVASRAGTGEAHARPLACSGGGRARAKVGSRKKPQRRVLRPAGLDLVRRRQAQQDRLSSSRDGRSARISSSRGSSGSRSVGSESGERGASCGSTEMLLQQSGAKQNVFWHKRARAHRDEVQEP